MGVEVCIWKDLSYPNTLFKKQAGKFFKLFIIRKMILTGKPHFDGFDTDSSQMLRKIT